MEDVSQSLQEVHERCEGLAEQITTVEHGLKALETTRFGPFPLVFRGFFHGFPLFFLRFCGRSRSLKPRGEAGGEDGHRGLERHERRHRPVHSDGKGYGLFTTLRGLFEPLFPLISIVFH